MTTDAAVLTSRRGFALQRRVRRSLATRVNEQAGSPPSTMYSVGVARLFLVRRTCALGSCPRNSAQRDRTEGKINYSVVAAEFQRSTADGAVRGDGVPAPARMALRPCLVCFLVGALVVSSGSWDWIVRKGLWARARAVAAGGTNASAGEWRTSMMRWCSRRSCTCWSDVSWRHRPSCFGASKSTRTACSRCKAMLGCGMPAPDDPGRAGRQPSGLICPRPGRHVSCTPVNEGEHASPCPADRAAAGFKLHILSEATGYAPDRRCLSWQHPRQGRA